MSPGISVIWPRIPHGTFSGYSYWGCRCDDCKGVEAAYQAAYYQRPEIKAKAAAYYRELQRLARLAKEAGLG